MPQVSQVERGMTDAHRLARLLALRRVQASASLSLDGYERWGNGSQYAQLEAHTELANAIGRTEKAIVDLTRTLRERDPQALDTVIDGQLRLLEAHMATVADDSTEAYVVREEREAWEAIRRGDRDLLHQNTFYVHQDPELFAEIFGFGPFEVDLDLLD